MSHIMIDIETLGTKPGSAILSIGAVVFSAEGVSESTFFRAISLQSCIDVGLKIDPATVAWWMSQSDAARAAAFPAETEHLNVALFALRDWFVEQSGEQTWCHGAAFDVPLLETAYEAAGLAQLIPWKFWNVRCTRTLYDESGVTPDRSTGAHHHPVDDARNQALAVIQAKARLGSAW